MTNIHLHNVNLTSTSGPNSFGKKLFNSLRDKGVTFNAEKDADAALVFIESNNSRIKAPIIQRLDGIYFNSEQDYTSQNKNILSTYKSAKGVVFQSEFNRTLTTKYFDEHQNYIVIHNGSDTDLIAKLPKLEADVFSNYDKVWMSASSWRPHKRLQQNIEYFLEHSGHNDVMLVAGDTKEKPITDKKVKYLGNLDYLSLLRIYKSSDYFIHLAWLDHCPNVVVDARACGCKIVCSSSGGTKEIAGSEAIVIEEEEWDFSPVALYKPPALDFTSKIKNIHESVYNMREVGQKYLDFINRTINL